MMIELLRGSFPSTSMMFPPTIANTFCFETSIFIELLNSCIPYVAARLISSGSNDS